jgi:hypothetical protein
MGLLVFENVAAKDTVDVVVALSKGKELRTAGIRIRTSSLGADGSWRFSEDIAKYSIEKTPFFYIFCCGRKTEGKLFSEPAFVIVPQAQLKKMTKTFREGNYHIEISHSQLGEESRWANFINNFQQIKDSLEG